MQEISNYITIDPEVCFGKPCIIGTRISVGSILNWLSTGMTINEIIEDFPELKEIHEYCQNNRQPVPATGNGQGNFVVMTQEMYDEMTGNSRKELYNALQAGLDQINNGEYITEEEHFKHLDELKKKL
ncbi:MAG: DUF433 domain-containing protein [Treponema sp.]|nr:DUF433 domain-containing protein [Treponema sp.]